MTNQPKASDLVAEAREVAKVVEQCPTPLYALNAVDLIRRLADEVERLQKGHNVLNAALGASSDDVISLQERLTRVVEGSRQARAREAHLSYELRRAAQFCEWLSVDSKKYAGTDAGNAARRLLVDLRQALAEETPNP